MDSVAGTEAVAVQLLHMSLFEKEDIATGILRLSNFLSN